jgi:hypothetical protein
MKTNLYNFSALKFKSSGVYLCDLGYMKERINQKSFLARV